MTSVYAREGSAAHRLAEILLRGDPAPEVIRLEASPEAHSVYGGSQRERFSACPGSVRLIRTLPLQPPEPPIDVEITDEMLRAVTSYVAYVRSIPGTLLVEQTFSVPPFHSDFRGTADAVLIFDALHAEIIDYKHGSGHVVEVLGNPQLLAYAVGLMRSGIIPMTVERIRVTIVQPRADHPDGYIRSADYTRGEIIEEGNTLRKEILACESLRAPLVPGSHCRWCPAAHVCPEQTARANAAAVTAFSPVPGPELGDLLRKLEALDAWSSRVREYAYQEAEAGRVPRGWKLVEKRAVRRWKDGVDETVLIDGLGILPSDVIERKLRSPAQLEKLVPPERKEDFISLVARESSGLKLVPQEAPGEPVHHNVVPFLPTKETLLS